MKSIPTKISLVIIIALIAVVTGGSPPVHAQSDLITFAVIGDYGLAGQPLLDVSNLIKSWNPDFIVTVGDNNYPHGQAGTIDDNIGQYFHEYLFKYKGKYGSGSPVRRFFPSLGNHDWDTGAKAYFDFFGYYNPTTYYDFIQGPVHFFVLDSDRDEPDGVFADDPQGRWLRKALAASTSSFNVVYFHHAPYSSGRHGSTEYMRWPFKEWGADAVLTGHDHIYERLSVDGIPYFVNGIGGSELYWFENILPESQVRFNQDFGAMRVEATSAYMKFQMYTRAGLLVDEYTIGGSTPTVTSITRLDANPTNAGVVNFQVNFSEAVTGVDTSDFILNTTTTGASIANLTGTGNIYTLAVNTGGGDGTLRLDLADNDSILSSLGISLGGSGASNGNYNTGEVYTVDKTSPSVASILPADPSPTNAANVDFSVTFTESVTGVDLADFSLTTTNGAALNAINGSGANYVVSVTTGSGSDELRLDFLDNDTVIDIAGNATSTGFTGGGTSIIDRAAPLVTSISAANQTNANSVEYTVNFSEPVTGVDGGDFLLSTFNGATITNVTGSGSQYLVSISVQPGSDSLRLDLNDNDSIMDAVGNLLGGSGASNGNFIGGVFNIAIDKPIVTSIIRSGASPTNAAQVDFVVTFSEPVEGVDASDFLLTNGANILAVNNSNPFFIVTVQTGPTDGEIIMELIDDDSIHNAQGVFLGGEGAGNANFTRGESYTVDRTAPQITSIIRAGNNPAINPTADFIVTFSEPVLGVELTDFTIIQTNIIKSSVINIQNSDPVYWVTVRTGAGSGSIRLDLLDNGNITDKAGNPITNNAYTSGESFTVGKTAVDFSAPGINALPNSFTNNPFLMLTWSSVINAQAYEILIARDSGFSQIAANTTTTEAAFVAQSALTDGAYYAKVRAYNQDLNPGKWSKTYTFTIDSTPPPSPTPLSPSNASTTPRRPWLKWSAVSGAKDYQVEVDNNADFSSPEFSGIAARPTIQVKNLLGRTYYWRVRAEDPAGNWSAWSAVFSFKAQ
ncbi:MAG: metallophosphoesterase [Anaerolineales bacterium]|uniref:metallophosphoesterase n=1 Tax=Candidatus Villigracilis vicinus TaxID=3140679 RepID=UPI003135C007|nr:metallophosphoesterase [Anaerolineales bacterium]